MRTPTSTASYEALTDRRASQLRVLDVIRSSGHGWTGGELNRALGVGEGNPSYHRRAAELVAAGELVLGRDRPDEETGRTCKTYEIPSAAYRALAADDGEYDLTADEWREIHRLSGDGEGRPSW